MSDTSFAEAWSSFLRTADLAATMAGELHGGPLDADWQPIQTPEQRTLSDYRLEVLLLLEQRRTLALQVAGQSALGGLHAATRINALHQAAYHLLAWEGDMLRRPWYEQQRAFATARRDFADALAVGPADAVDDRTPPCRPKGVTLAEAEARVREWLAKHAKQNPFAVTRDAVAASVGASAGLVSKTSAWKAFRDRRDADRPSTPRTVPLSDGMRAVIPADCDLPDELAALIEEQRAEEAEQNRRHSRRHDGES